jgi:hypothetical protein
MNGGPLDILAIGIVIGLITAAGLTELLLYFGRKHAEAVAALNAVRERPSALPSPRRGWER